MSLKLAAPLALALAGAFAVPAFAETNEVYTPIQPAPRAYYYTAPTYYVPADTYYVQRDPVPETTTIYSYTPDTTSYYVTPEPVYYSGYTVYGTRGDYDGAISADVQDNIRSDPYINGHIDVDSRRGDVTLQGLVSTPGQADRAGYRAREVDGVGNIDNQVRARVGSQ